MSECYCSVCGEEYSPRRAALGYTTCLLHGEAKKEFPIVPVPKSNYIIATKPSDLVSPYSHKGNR